MKTQYQPQDVDLSNVEFNSDGVVRMALDRKETQKRLWESMQQFQHIVVTSKSK